MSQSEHQRLRQPGPGRPFRKRTTLKLVTLEQQLGDLDGTEIGNHLPETLLAGGATNFGEIDQTATLFAEALGSTDASLRQLLEKARILVWTADAESSCFTFVSKEVMEMLGYAVADWYEPGFLSSHLHPEDQQQILRAGNQHFSFVDNPDLTFRMLASDGRVVWLRCLVNVTPDDRDAKQINGLMIDITEQ